MSESLVPSLTSGSRILAELKLNYIVEVEELGFAALL